MSFSCYGCTNRHAACHATCEIYKREKAAHEAQKDREREAKRIQSGLNDHVVAFVRKAKSKRGKKWNGKEGRNIE